MLEFTEKGMFCKPGKFYLDPYKPVEKAVISHAHSDHGRAGHKKYYCHKYTEPFLRARLGQDLNVTSFQYNQPFHIGQVEITLIPAGHICGSSQILIEYKGERVVFSGDYKTDPDPTTNSFIPVSCDTFISECTFGLPVFNWPDPNLEIQRLKDWCQTNHQQGYNSILLVYSLGKAQRILYQLQEFDNIFLHGATHNMTALHPKHLVFPHYQTDLERLTQPGLEPKKHPYLILAPGSTLDSKWMKRFTPYKVASISGWMTLRGTRRRQGLDAGFIISDHADWSGLNQAIDQTQATNIILTHGYTEIFSQYLQEKGHRVAIESTDFQQELTDK